jgi:hypothetical protein
MVPGFVSVLLLAVLIYKIAGRLRGRDRGWFLAGAGVRMCGGVTLGVLYTFYYHGDTWAYFDRAMELSELIKLDPRAYVDFLFTGQVEGMAPRASFFVKAISPFVFLSGDNYWITSLWLSTCAFLGSWYLVRRLTGQWPSLAWPAAIAFLFTPTLVLWGSGIIKESLATGALFFLAAIVVGVVRTHRLSAGEAMMGVASAFFLWNLKYYYAAVFLAAALPLLAAHFASGFVKLAPAVLWASALVIMMLLVTALHPNFYPENFLDVIVSNHDAFVRLSQPGGYIRYQDIHASWESVLGSAPLALVSGMFRPFVWEVGNLPGFLAAMENLFLLALSIVGMAGLTRVKREERLWVLSTLFYCFVLAVFLALSTPNFGTLVRYKVGFVPFLVYLSAAGTKSLLSRWKIL